MIIFGIPKSKDKFGSEAWNPDGIVQVALKDLKEMKSEHSRKMNQVKLLEMELENKLAGVKNDLENADDGEDDPHGGGARGDPQRHP